MAVTLLPLDILGAIENNGTVTFGLWLPWVADNDGNSVKIKIIHERDQFLKDVLPREFPMTHSVRQPFRRQCLSLGRRQQRQYRRGARQAVMCIAMR
jgi:hypothetical protein